MTSFKLAQALGESPKTLQSAMDTMSRHMIDALYSFMPEYVAETNGVKELVGPNTSNQLQRLDAAMGKMRQDSDPIARDLFCQFALLVVDGTGTVVRASTDLFARRNSFCSWKHEYQLRWFVVVDMTGCILFVSDLYPGKVDDTKALDCADFYM